MEVISVCLFKKKKTPTSAHTKSFKYLYPSAWHRYKADEQNVPPQAPVLPLTVVIACPVTQ